MYFIYINNIIEETGKGDCKRESLLYISLFTLFLRDLILDKSVNVSLTYIYMHSLLSFIINAF